MSTEDQIQDLWKAHHKSKEELLKRINDLEGEQRETDAIVRGPDGTNGLRSRVVILERESSENTGELQELRGELRHYLDAERLATCHGIAALDEHQKDHDKLCGEEKEMKLKKMEGSQMLWVQFVQLAGILAVAAMNAYVAMNLVKK